MLGTAVLHQAHPGTAAVYRAAVYGEIQVGLCPNHPVLPLEIILLDLIFEPHRGAVGQ